MIKRRPIKYENCTLPEESKVTEQGQALSILDVMVRVKKGLGTGVCTLRSYLADENDVDDWPDDELTPIDQVEAMEVERNLEESIQSRKSVRKSNNTNQKMENRLQNEVNSPEVPPEKEDN